jgi:hypothetical protein
LSGWKISAGGYTVPPLPKGVDFDEYIARRRADLNWATNSALWLPLFTAKREEELTAIYGAYDGLFNRVGRHFAWDGVLASRHGYVPTPVIAAVAADALENDALDGHRLPIRRSQDGVVPKKEKQHVLPQGRLYLRHPTAADGGLAARTQ